jgi:nitrogenase molybdenum-iron protein beta chain
LASEIGYIPKGVYIIDEPGESKMNAVVEAAVSREEKLKDLVFFEGDGGLIQRDIRKRLGKSRKALFLGSSWEKSLAQETNNFYAFLSLPLPESVIFNKSYVGYDGGLNLLEEIYTNIFKGKTTTSRTQFIIDEAG